MLVVVAQRVLHALEAVLTVVGRLASLDDVRFARLLAGHGLAGTPQRLLRVGLAATAL
jgi:hypothetical protein